MEPEELAPTGEPTTPLDAAEAPAEAPVGDAPAEAEAGVDLAQAAVDLELARAKQRLADGAYEVPPVPFGED